MTFPALKGECRNSVMKVLIEPRGHEQLEIDAPGNSIKIGAHPIDATSLERISRCEAPEVHARGIHPPMDYLSVWEHGTEHLAKVPHLIEALPIFTAGKPAFIVPASDRAGIYFERLRKDFS